MKKFFRKLHRWLGLLMAAQIIAWMASGLYFSLVPINEVRGEHLTRPAEQPDVRRLDSIAGPAHVGGLLDREMGEGWTLSNLSLVSVNGKTSWKLEGEVNGSSFTRLLSDDGRSFLPRLSKEDAGNRAAGWLLEPAEPLGVEWVEHAGDGSEIRGRALPVWKVSFAQPEALNLYLDPWTGELLARRTARWRIFDFLWMLHIMDFDARDDFNHPLLQVASALGLLIALSGLIYWGMTTRLFRRRPRSGVQRAG